VAAVGVVAGLVIAALVIRSRRAAAGPPQAPPVKAVVQGVAV
jgi:hypothetical protein